MKLFVGKIWNEPGEYMSQRIATEFFVCFNEYEHFNVLEL